MVFKENFGPPGESPNRKDAHENKENPVKLDKMLMIEISMAEKPIRNILARLNLIGKKQFPDANLRSVGSCSGHVDREGHLQRYDIFAELKAELKKYADRKDSNLEEIRRDLEDVKTEDLPYHEPSVSFVAEGYKKEIEEIKNFFDSLFNLAVKSTNDRVGQEAIEYERFSERLDRKINSISFYFPVNEKDKAFEVLKVFWEEIETEMAKIDGITKNSEFKPEDFIHKSFETEGENQEK